MILAYVQSLMSTFKRLFISKPLHYFYYEFFLAHISNIDKTIAIFVSVYPIQTL